MSKQTLISVASLLGCVLLGYVLWNPFVVPLLRGMGVLGQPSGQIASQQDLNDIVKLSVGDDFEAIADTARKVAESAPDANTQSAARAYEAYGKFMIGTQQARIAAVNSVIEEYTKAVRDEDKVFPLNQLIQFVLVDRTRPVYDAVFKSETFKKYYNADSYVASVAALAKESYQAQHTVVGAVYMLLEDEAALVNFDKVYTLTPAQKKAHADALVVGIPLITAAFEEEMQRSGSAEEKSILPFTYYNYLALYNTAVGKVYKEYQAQAVDAYKKLFEYYETTKGADGRHSPILEVRVWEDQVRYAKLLYSMDPVRNLPEAQNQIKALMAMVEANPDLHEHGVVLYFRNIAKGNFVDDEQSTKSLQKVATIYPPFKDFVKQYGVILK